MDPIASGGFKWIFVRSCENDEQLQVNDDKEALFKSIEKPLTELFCKSARFLQDM